MGSMVASYQERVSVGLTAEPGIKMMAKQDVENNWIPVCARNYMVDKQRCNLDKTKYGEGSQEKHSDLSI